MYKKLWKVRYIWMIGIMVLMYSTSFAQTLTTDEPVPQKMWEVLVKAAFPLLMTAFGPFVTSFITKAPPLVKYIVAGLASMIAGMLAGQIDGFPLTSESAANMGVGLGPVGQAMVNGWLKKEEEATK